MEKKFLTPQEVCDQFGIDLDSLQRLVDEGHLKALADRGSWKYRWDELKKLEDSGRLARKSSASPSFSDQPIVDEELSFLELDEEALSGGTVPQPPSGKLSSDSDVKVVPDTRTPADENREVAQSLSQLDLEGVDSPMPGELSSVVPTSEPASSPGVPDSDSDVKVVTPRGSGVKKSDSDVKLVSGKSDSNMSSDSDVKVVSDADLPASGSDSDVKVVAGGGVSASMSSDSDVQVVTDDAVKTSGSDSDVQIVRGSAAAASDSDSDVRVVSAAGRPASGSDSDVKVVPGSDPAPAALTGKTDDLAAISDSGISLSDDDADSGLTTAVIPGASSSETPGLDKTDFLDSGISLKPVDSGLSLESSDSGISLGDSSIVLDDSGISLQEDSGLTLESAADSGISLEAAGSDISLDDSDSGITLTPHSSALSDQDLDETQPEFDNLDFNSDDFAVKFQSPGSGTAELEEIADEDVRETLPPPKSGKKPQPAGLSDTFQTTGSVADLEISEELDAGDLEVESGEFAVDADEDVFEDEESVEDILEADDELFDSSEAGSLGDESASAIRPVAVAPREPSWGLAAHIPIIASAVLLLVNALVLWGGVSTMWTGSELPAVSGSVVNALGNLF
ncbi:MAG: hypothetical protein U0872_02780 [Planctomycetaceae bacterium]